MPNEVRKMAFWEVARGEFAQRFQGDFEDAQKIAEERGVPVEVSAKIKIFPAKKDNPNCGGVMFSTNIKLTERVQLDLDFPDVKTHPFVPENVRSKVMDQQPPVPDAVPDGMNPETGEILD